MRCDFKQALPLRQRFEYQVELKIFEITNSTVDQFARAGTCAGCEIGSFNQSDFQSPAGCIACDTGPTNSAADNRNIVFGLLHFFDTAFTGAERKRFHWYLALFFSTRRPSCSRSMH